MSYPQADCFGKKKGSNPATFRIMKGTDPRLAAIRHAAIDSARASARLAQLIERYTLETAQSQPTAPSPSPSPNNLVNPAQRSHEGPPPQGSSQGSPQQPPQQGLPLPQQLPQQLAPQQGYPLPQQPAPRPAMGYPMARPQAVQRPSWWKREDLVTKVLAITGAIITVIGLTIFASLAFSSGRTGQIVTVVMVAMVCLAVAAASIPAHRRNPHSAVAPAMMITATLGALADIWVSAFAEPLPLIGPDIGVLLTTITCAASLGVAYMWRNQPQAILVTVLAPLFIVPVSIYILMHPEDYSIPTVFFPICLALLGVLGIATRWNRPWFAQQVVATITFLASIFIVDGNPFVVLFCGVLGVIVVVAIGYSQPYSSTALTLATTVVVLATPALVLVNSRIYWFALIIPVATALLVGFLILPKTKALALPPLKTPATLEVTLSATTLAAGITVAITLWSISTRPEPIPVVSAACIVGIAALAACAVSTIPRFFASGAWVFLSIALLAGVPYALSSWQMDPVRASAPNVLVTAALVGVLGIAIAKRRVLIGQRLTVDPWLLGIIFAPGLLYASSTVLAIFTWVNPTEQFYMFAQVVISIGWMGAGVYALNRRHNVVGLALAGFATMKLVFFDLSVLGGLVQVIAFLVSGIALLVAAMARDKPSQLPNGNVNGGPNGGPNGAPGNSRDPFNQPGPMGTGGPMGSGQPSGPGQPIGPERPASPANPASPATPPEQTGPKKPMGPGAPRP